MHISPVDKEISKYCYAIKYGFNAFCDIVCTDNDYLQKLGLLEQGYDQVSLSHAILTAITKDKHYNETVQDFTFPPLLPYDLSYEEIRDFFTIEIHPPEPRILNVPFFNVETLIRKIALELDRQSAPIMEKLQSLGFKGYCIQEDNTYNEALFDTFFFLSNEYTALITKFPEMHTKDSLPIESLPNIKEHDMSQLINKLENELEKIIDFKGTQKSYSNASNPKNKQSKGRPSNNIITWHIDKILFDMWIDYSASNTSAKISVFLEDNSDFTENFEDKAPMLYKEYSINEIEYHLNKYKKIKKPKFKNLISRMRKRIEQQKS